MRIDSYTKGVLTIIAVLLAVIALNQYVSPQAVQAQGPFAGVQFTGRALDQDFFDTRSGEIFLYSNGALLAKYRLTKLGLPLAALK